MGDRPGGGREQAEANAARIGAGLLGLDGGTDPFVAAVRATRMAMVVTDPRRPDNPIVFANDAFCRLTGYAREEILGRNCRFLQGPQTDPETVARIRAAVAAAEPIETDIRNHRKDGTPFWNRLLLAPVRDAAGELAYFFANQMDVTPERERLAGLEGRNAALVAELADRLRAQEAGAARLRLALEAGGLGDFEWDLRADAVRPSAHARAIFGFASGEGERSADYYARIPPEDRPRARAAVEAGLKAGQVAVGYRVRPPGGAVRHVLCRGEVVRGADGAPARLIGVFADETEREAAQAALRESEARLRALVSASSQVLYTMSPDWAEMRRFTGGGFLSDTGRPNRAWLEEYVHPDDQSRVAAAIEEAVRTRGVFELEHRVRRADGGWGWTHSRAVPILDAAGGIREWFGAAGDVTARKEAEAALRRANETLEARVAARTAALKRAVDALHAEARERERAEAALRQAQKMEAVGQLTGGIAHDFNNMLQGIGGAVELMRRHAAQGRAEEADRLGEMASETVGRAAALTHRLLAFARRQALDPKPVEPGALVAGMGEPIRRAVGPDVRVEPREGDGAWTVLCDPNGLENALLNLAINARDAMPGGGTLAIATEDVRLTEADVAGQDGARPGEYVEVSVSDTGAGMDEATRARAFEPFFTTKPIGQGTGLGLSQVYGFVRQSGGVVRLDSAPGRGTTVRLYLPRHEPAPGPGERPVSGEAAGAVLLVEDEAAVRAVAAEHLREAGYRVLEAADGPAALRLLRGGRRVDVLVTDVGLPGGLNGRQVAEAAREGRPGLPVLFITGYAGGALDGRLPPGTAVIGKPFALDALAAKVRAMLEAAPAG